MKTCPQCFSDLNGNVYCPVCGWSMRKVSWKVLLFIAIVFSIIIALSCSTQPIPQSDKIMFQKGKESYRTAVCIYANYYDHDLDLETLDSIYEVSFVTEQEKIK